MKRRDFPRTLLLMTGIAAGGLLAPQLARAQATPDPLIGSHGEDSLPTTDDSINGAHGTSDRSDTTRYTYETTQTSTGASSTGALSPPYEDTKIIQETTTERETHVRTEATTPPPAYATPDTHVYVEDRAEKPKFYGSGVGIEAGGGVNAFSNGKVAQMTDTGGAWSARLTFGTRSPLALEAAYIGTANRVQTLGLDRSTLLSNGAEAGLKLHVALVPLNESESVMLKPYVLAGFAYKRYELTGTGADSNTSSVMDSQNAFEIPIGFGLGWNFGHFIADQRFDYRPSLSGDLIRPTNGIAEKDASLSTWSIQARVGVEF